MSLCPAPSLTVSPLPSPSLTVSPALPDQPASPALQKFAAKLVRYEHNPGTCVLKQDDTIEKTPRLLFLSAKIRIYCDI